MGPAVYLKPGEWFFSEEPAVVETILGSCLGVVMRSSQGATSVAHCILPRWQGGGAPDSAFKYVDRCLPRMLSEFERRGVRRETLEVKLFGGASVLSGYDGRRRKVSVGRDNVEAAMEILRREGIRVTVCQVGGERGRKLIVDTGSGHVFVRMLGQDGGGVG